ncbi:MAG: rhodanese-like domain-containing protein [Paludibacter sp.]|nr:rhodanese-like domain-containing protein [Paludibacter sp.]
MKKVFSLGLLMSLLWSVQVMAQNGQKVEHLSAPDFKKTIETVKLVLIDVRTPREYTTGHIANAINIDQSDPDFAAKVKKQIGKSTLIGVYCRSGHRSKMAISKLSGLNVTIYELDRGLISWQQANFLLK